MNFFMNNLWFIAILTRVEFIKSVCAAESFPPRKQQRIEIYGIGTTSRYENDRPLKRRRDSADLFYPLYPLIDLAAVVYIQYAQAVFPAMAGNRTAGTGCIHVFKARFGKHLLYRIHHLV